MASPKKPELKVNPYDKRSGAYWALGQDLGQGKPQPVGTKNSPSAEACPSESYRQEIRP